MGVLLGILFVSAFVLLVYILINPTASFKTNMIFSFVVLAFDLTVAFGLSLSGYTEYIQSYGTESAKSYVNVVTVCLITVSLALIVGVWALYFDKANLTLACVVAFFSFGTVGVIRTSSCDAPKLNDLKALSQVATASSVVYGEDNLYCNIATVQRSCAIEVIDIIKEKDKEDLYIVEIEGKSGVFTKKLSKSDFDEKIGYDSTHVTADYLTINFISYDPSIDGGFSYETSALCMPGETFNSDVYAKKALDYFNGDYSDGYTRLWWGDFKSTEDLKTCGYTPYTAIDNKTYSTDAVQPPVKTPDYISINSVSDSNILDDFDPLGMLMDYLMRC